MAAVLYVKNADAKRRLWRSAVEGASALTKQTAAGHREKLNGGIRFAILPYALTQIGTK